MRPRTVRNFFHWTYKWRGRNAYDREQPDHTESNAKAGPFPRPSVNHRYDPASMEDEMKGQRGQEDNRDPEMDFAPGVAREAPNRRVPPAPRREHVAHEDAGSSQKDEASEGNGVNRNVQSQARHPIFP